MVFVLFNEYLMYMKRMGCRGGDVVGRGGGGGGEDSGY